MAIVMQMHWPEITQEQYEAVRKDVGWERDVPRGAKYHVAWFGTDGFHVIDVWESQALFDQFMQARLAPGIQRAGIKGQPNLQFSPVHASFAANP